LKLNAQRKEKKFISTYFSESLMKHLGFYTQESITEKICSSHLYMKSALRFIMFLMWRRHGAMGNNRGFCQSRIKQTPQENVLDAQ